MYSLSARPGVQALRSSKIREVANASMGKEDVIAFWFGEPDEVTPDFIRQAGIEALQRGDTFYTENFGIPALREAIARYLTRLHRPAGTAAITLDNIAEIAATGVDYASSGALTHSAPALDVGLDVGEEQHLALARSGRQLRREGLEHAEAGLERLAAVEVPAVLAGPEEGLAGDVLDVADIDAAASQDVELGLAEVIADRADDADLIEEGGGQREVHGGAAEHAGALAERRLNGVVGD